MYIQKWIVYLFAVDTLFNFATNYARYTWIDAIIGLCCFAMMSWLFFREEVRVLTPDQDSDVYTKADGSKVTGEELSK